MRTSVENCGFAPVSEVGVPLELSIEEINLRKYYCPVYGEHYRLQPLIITQGSPTDPNEVVVACPNTNCATHQGHPSKQKNG